MAALATARSGYAELPLQSGHARPGGRADDLLGRELALVMLAEEGPAGLRSDGSGPVAHRRRLVMALLGTSPVFGVTLLMTGLSASLQPQGIVTDIRMPPAFQREGIDAAKQVRKRRRPPGWWCSSGTTTPTTPSLNGPTGLPQKEIPDKSSWESPANGGCRLRACDGPGTYPPELELLGGAPAGIEPATPSLPWNHREPLCQPPFPQVALDRRGRSYRFSSRDVVRSHSVA
jgi:CheY-like chemotaxis protein